MACELSTAEKGGLGQGGGGGGERLSVISTSTMRTGFQVRNRSIVSRTPTAGRALQIAAAVAVINGSRCALRARGSRGSAFSSGVLTATPACRLRPD